MSRYYFLICSASASAIFMPQMELLFLNLVSFSYAFTPYRTHGTLQLPITLSLRVQALFDNTIQRTAKQTCRRIGRKNVKLDNRRTLVYKHSDSCRNIWIDGQIREIQIRYPRVLLLGLSENRKVKKVLGTKYNF